jgi:acetylornithine deacetylase
MSLADEVARRATEEVVPLLQRLLSFDTTVADRADPPRDDLAHQDFVAGYLRDLGAEVTLFTPGVDELRDHPMYQDPQTLEGRPILWARLPGSGAGPSLLFNGHYDTVAADPIDEWTHDPWSGTRVDGRVYGRGANDMKGGIAAALAAARAIAECDVPHAGDVLFNWVPFEEINGIGTIATLLRGYRADAAICCEPTSLNTVVGCRGTLLGRLVVEGRSAHAEIVQPHHSKGGGVNAIDKLIDVLLALRTRNDDWRLRPDKQHDLMAAPQILTTIMKGGNFASNWPESASAVLNVCYLPSEADRDGGGSAIKAELVDCVQAAARRDSWLRDHLPEIDWLIDFPAAELPVDDPFVASVSSIAREHGLDGSRVAAFDGYADQVAFLRAGIPCVCFGPAGDGTAHAVDEFVVVDDLEACARVYADFALRLTAPA